MSIEGIPLITRFKTFQLHIGLAPLRSIEGIPLITRFKTFLLTFAYSIGYHCIEGIPLITRFKTAGELIGLLDDWGVLKVFHL